MREPKMARSTTTTLIYILVCLVLVCELTLAEPKRIKEKTNKSKIKEWLGWREKLDKDPKAKSTVAVSKDKYKPNYKDQANEPSTDRQEGNRICQAIHQETLPDFFLKFGLVTSLIEDVNAFKRKMKSGNIFVQKKKRFRLDATGEVDNDGKDLYKSKDGLKLTKPFKSNYLHRKKQRASNEKHYMPPCYGFNYLSSIEAILETENKLEPDTARIQDSLSDMSDMDLSAKLFDVIESCASKKNQSGCPSLSIVSHMKSCPKLCTSDRDCSTGERCCPSSCGGTSCYNPDFQSKYRNDDDGLQSVMKCKIADSFLQCIYKEINQNICDGTYRNHESPSS